MRFEGELRRSGRWWLAEVPVFDAVSQGRTRREALEMIGDWFVTLVDRRGFAVDVRETGPRRFDVGSNDGRAMISLLLRRQRQRSGLSLAEASLRLDAKSRNAYARYEQGLCVPTIEKLDSLLRAVSPDRDLVIGQGAAA